MRSSVTDDVALAVCGGPLRSIGGFRDTYSGRQVVSRPGGLRAGTG